MPCPPPTSDLKNKKLYKQYAYFLVQIRIFRCNLRIFGVILQNFPGGMPHPREFSAHATVDKFPVLPIYTFCVNRHHAVLLSR